MDTLLFSKQLFEFDDKINPLYYLNIDADINPNNITHIYNFEYGNHKILETKYEYTYNANGYPVYCKWYGTLYNYVFEGTFEYIETL